ncbi:hypothetical protein ARMSODRAFT_299493 [Armillaria solidipes]|uniref:Uncharacterized protein n=1 Tax=Armillaria solidipes TaxID=1076256 RepID=A0A2H3BDI8_9AGAR|nr:hypothetical protein ARMSODRAFT_299493 [Armillaria solidipes]
MHGSREYHPTRSPLSSSLFVCFFPSTFGSGEDRELRLGGSSCIGRGKDAVSPWTSLRTTRVADSEEVHVPQRHPHHRCTLAGPSGVEYEIYAHPAWYETCFLSSFGMLTNLLACCTNVPSHLARLSFDSPSQFDLHLAHLIRLSETRLSRDQPPPFVASLFPMLVSLCFVPVYCSLLDTRNAPGSSPGGEMLYILFTRYTFCLR